MVSELRQMITGSATTRLKRLIPSTKNGSPLGLRDTTAVREDMAGDHAASAAIDEAFGVVRGALRDSDRPDNNLALITTDHGFAFPAHECCLHDTGIGGSRRIETATAASKLPAG